MRPILNLIEAAEHYYEAVEGKQRHPLDNKEYWKDQLLSSLESAKRFIKVLERVQPVERRTGQTKIVLGNISLKPLSEEGGVIE